MLTSFIDTWKKWFHGGTKCTGSNGWDHWSKCRGLTDLRHF